MTTKLNHTILAYLLALQDLPHSLNEAEQANLKEVAKQLRTQPEAWNDYIEPSLVAIIQGNSPLNQSYQHYKNKLDNFGEIPFELLPTADEINQLVKTQAAFVNKGFDDNSLPTGIDKQIENAFIVLGQSETSEETVKKLGSIGKLKQFLSKPTQHSYQHS